MSIRDQNNNPISTCEIVLSKNIDHWTYNVTQHYGRCNEEPTSDAVKALEWLRNSIDSSQLKIDYQTLETKRKKRCNHTIVTRFDRFATFWGYDATDEETLEKVFNTYQSVLPKKGKVFKEVVAKTGESLEKSLEESFGCALELPLNLYGHSSLLWDKDFEHKFFYVLAFGNHGELEECLRDRKLTLLSPVFFDLTPISIAAIYGNQANVECLMARGVRQAPTPSKLAYTEFQKPTRRDDNKDLTDYVIAHLEIIEKRNAFIDEIETFIGQIFNFYIHTKIPAYYSLAITLSETLHTENGKLGSSKESIAKALNEVIQAHYKKPIPKRLLHATNATLHKLITKQVKVHPEVALENIQATIKPHLKAIPS